MQLRVGVFGADSGFRIRRAEVGRCQINRTVTDADTYTAGPIVFRGILLDRDERIGLHGVNRAVRKGDTGVGIRPRFYLIAFVERGAEIRLDPLDGIDFLDFDFAVEVDEFGVFLIGAEGFHLGVAYLVADLLDHYFVEVRFGKVKSPGNNRYRQERVTDHRLISDRSPIYFNVRALRVGLRRFWIDGCLCGHG